MKYLVFIVFIVFTALGCNNKNKAIEKQSSKTEANTINVTEEQDTISIEKDTINKFEILGKWKNKRCNIEVDIKKVKSKYVYTLTSKARIISDSLSFSKDGNTTYITFEGIEWSENTLEQSNKKRNIKEKILPVGISALYNSQEKNFVIQNYGNAIHQYKKLKEGCEKYLYFNKEKAIDTLKVLYNAVSSIKNYHIIDWKKGDIDNDKQDDFVIVMESDKTRNEPLENTFIRKVVLLKATNFSNFKILATNDGLVECTTCGGAGVGDPFMGISIKNGYFSIEELFGACVKTYIVITFKFMKGDFYLQSIGSEDHYCKGIDGSGDPEVTFSKETKNDFGWIKFEDYSSY